MRYLLAGLVAAGLLAAPLSAQEDPSPSAEDWQVLESRAQGIFDLLKMQNSELAASLIFEGFGDDTSDKIEDFSVQLDKMLDSDGQLQRCEVVRRENLGSLMAKLIYACQHTRDIAVWTITFEKPAIGWRLTTVSFSTNYEF